MILKLESEVFPFFLTPVFFVVEEHVSAQLLVLGLLFDFERFEPSEVLYVKAPTTGFQLFGCQELFVTAYQELVIYVLRGVFNFGPFWK